MNNISNTWDQALLAHHVQLLEKKDVTFSKVFLPLILQLLHEQENHTTFTAIDIGCSTGFLTCILADHVHSIVGIDPSEAAAKVAREYAQKPNLAIENCSVEDYAKKQQNQFDLAIAHMTLHVIENLDLALRSIAIILKQNGILIFSVPHPCFWHLTKDVGFWNLAENSPSGNQHKYHVDSFCQNLFQIDNHTIPVPHFHRSLESYSTAINKNGLRIKRIIEPFPDDEVMRKYKKPWPYPRFLFVICEKA